MFDSPFCSNGSHHGLAPVLPKEPCAICPADITFESICNIIIARGWKWQCSSKVLMVRVTILVISEKLLTGHKRHAYVSGPIPAFLLTLRPLDQEKSILLLRLCCHKAIQIQSNMTVSCMVPVLTYDKAKPDSRPETCSFTASCEKLSTERGNINYLPRGGALEKCKLNCYV